MRLACKGFQNENASSPRIHKYLRHSPEKKRHNIEGLCSSGVNCQMPRHLFIWNTFYHNQKHGPSIHRSKHTRFLNKQAKTETSVLCDWLCDCMKDGTNVNTCSVGMHKQKIKSGNGCFLKPNQPERKSSCRNRSRYMKSKVS